jgi:hypothetical protein
MAFAVRDEGDILDLKLSHHLDCGFRHFHIIDHGSTDASSDILAKYVKLNCVSLIQKHRDTPASNSWIDELIQAARARNPNAYLTICDADEFIFPQKDLREFMDGESAYALQRKNCFPDHESLTWSGKDLFSVFRNIVDRGHNTSSLRKRIQLGEPLAEVFDTITVPILFQDLSETPKLFLPLAKIHSLGPGAHKVTAWSDSGQQDLISEDALTIRHYPVRSLTGMRSRAATYQKLFHANPSWPNIWGWQNRYFVHLAHHGQLENEWNRHILPAQMDALEDGAFRIGRLTDN